MSNVLYALLQVDALTTIDPEHLTITREMAIQNDVCLQRLREAGQVLLGEPFEKGFQETLKYKEQTGGPDAPYHYQTPEGYKLGRWQSYHRGSYWKDKLSTQRTERLLKIGFMFANPR